jgi:hypothetical protein
MNFHFVRNIMSRLWSMGLTLSLTLALGLVGFAPSASAQTAHSVTLAWTASSDAAANPSLTYNVYRLNGACPATAPTAISGSGFTKLNTSGLTTTTYKDTTVAPGVYCYFASAFLNTAESVPSNDAQGTILPAAPTSLGITAVAEAWRSPMVQVKVPG